MFLVGQLDTNNSIDFLVKSLNKSIVKLIIIVPPCIKVALFSYKSSVLTDASLMEIANIITMSPSTITHVKGSGHSAKKPTPVAG